MKLTIHFRYVAEVLGYIVKNRHGITGYRLTWSAKALRHFTARLAPILTDNDPILTDNDPILTDNAPILTDNAPILTDNVKDEKVHEKINVQSPESPKSKAPILILD
jgi:hypothetical protein